MYFLVHSSGMKIAENCLVIEAQLDCSPFWCMSESLELAKEGKKGVLFRNTFVLLSCLENECLCYKSLSKSPNKILTNEVWVKNMLTNSFISFVLYLNWQTMLSGAGTATASAAIIPYAPTGDRVRSNSGGTGHCWGSYYQTTVSDGVGSGELLHWGSPCINHQGWCCAGPSDQPREPIEDVNFRWGVTIKCLKLGWATLNS